MEHRANSAIDGANSEARKFRHMKARSNVSHDVYSTDLRNLEGQRRQPRKHHPAKRPAITAECRQKPLPSLPPDDPDEEISVTYLGILDPPYIDRNLLDARYELHADQI